MNSNAVDPLQLLKALSPLLSDDGRIKSSQEVVRLVSLMRDAKKLVSRCTYCNILKVTTDKSALDKFVEVGGWNVLNTWLVDAKDENNLAMLTEVMKILKQLPMTIDILKQNNTAKVVKQISKGDYNEQTKQLASNLVTEWMSLIKTSSTTDKPEKKKKKKTNGPKEGEEKKKRSAKMSVPAHAKFRSTGLEKETKLPPVKLKKKTSTGNSDKPSVPKYLKRTGTELNKSVQPPEKKTKPTPVTTSTTTTSTPTFTSSNSTATTTSTSTAQKKAKLIPARPKPIHIIHESGGFMDALNAPAAPIRKKTNKVKPGNKAATPTSPNAPKVIGHPLSGAVKNSYTEDNAAEEQRPGTPTPDDEVKDEPPKISFYGASQNEDTSTNEKMTDANQTEGILSMKSKKKKSVSWVDDLKVRDLVQVCYFELDETERVNVNSVRDFRDAAHMEMIREKETMESAKRGMQSRAAAEKVQTDFMPWKIFVIDLITSLARPGSCSTEKDAQREREKNVLQSLFFDKASLPDSPHEPDPEQIDPTEANPKEVKIIPLEDESNMDSSTPLSYTHEMSKDSPPKVNESPTLHHPDPQQLSPHPGIQQNSGSLPPALATLMKQAKGPGNTPPPASTVAASNQPTSPTTTVKNVQNLLSSIMGNPTNGQQGYASQQTGEDVDMTKKLKQILEPFKNQLPSSNMGDQQQINVQQQQQQQHQQQQQQQQLPPGMPPPGMMEGMDPMQFPPPGPPMPMPGAPMMGPGGPMPMPPSGHMMPPGGPMPMPPREGLLPPPQPGMPMPFPPPGMDGPMPPMGPGFHDQGPYQGGPPPGPMRRGSPRSRGPPRGRGSMRGRGGRGRYDDYGTSRGRGPMRGRGRGRGRGSDEVCYHFMSDRGCRYGNSCMYYHPQKNGPSQAQE
ncbi:serine/threonine-protein phosphatase 1 regulatory subunit 10-like [Saccoglossus kowalevskii]|uniref:Serine/threonine-protein phosphatase 1 regulatory subunit 10 n=1 Tax=Saccoglossus kowalevskii TaxID=10224 RepID=A0ABM0M7K5_SACKO|nr:PREDICTED: serine/threonine-protein phosphatase 1 regulatory subunit 10-like [Saccoglossus kowalevskii]